MKIVQGFGFEVAKNTPPPPKLWTCVQGTGVWRLITASPMDTVLFSLLMQHFPRIMQHYGHYTQEIRRIQLDSNQKSEKLNSVQYPVHNNNNNNIYFLLVYNNTFYCYLIILSHVDNV